MLILYPQYCTYTQNIIFNLFSSCLHVFFKLHDPLVQKFALLLWFLLHRCLLLLSLWTMYPFFSHLYSCGLYFSGSINYYCIPSIYGACSCLISKCHHLTFFSPYTFAQRLFSGLFSVAVSLLMSLLFLIIVTGFEVGGGEAVSA